jgi:peptide/nickel transport system substrate-binding protein
MRRPDDGTTADPLWIGCTRIGCTTDHWGAGRPRMPAWLASATAVALLAAACGGPADSEAPAVSNATSAATKPAGDPVRGDWIVRHILSDPENLNPITSSDKVASDVLALIFPRLLRLDNETLELRPLLARELPEISDDKLSYTFRLRDDVTFADGTPMTASDVIFTLQAIKNPAVRAPHIRNYFESVQDVVAEDPHTVRFILRRPYFRNDVMLGGIEPLPRHYYDPDNALEGVTIQELESLDQLPPERQERTRRFADRFNEEFLRRPMGPGAFELRDPARDVVTGERIVLRRRQNFWAPNALDFGDAWVDRVMFRVINNPEGALTSLKRGDIDVLALTPIQHRDQTSSAAFARKTMKQEHASLSYTYIGWNQKRSIFQDVRVRRALSHLVDKQAIVDSVLLGLGQPIESPIYVDQAEYNRSLEPYAFDPARARGLLAEAGWTDSDGDGVLDKEHEGQRVPLRFEIVSNSGNTSRRAVGLAVIDEMKRAGIAASFRELDWSIMLDRVDSFEYDAVVLGWQMPPTAPDLFQVWHSSQAVADGSNHVYYKNPELDAILEEYRVEFDPSRRKQLYDRAQEMIYADQPYTFLYTAKAVTAWDARFRNVRWYASGETYYPEWWVPASAQRYEQ